MLARHVNYTIKDTAYLSQLAIYLLVLQITGYADII